MSDDKLVPVRGLLESLISTTPTGPYRPPNPYQVDNRVYRDQTLVLDQYTFSNCAFINCHLHTRKGSFFLRSCFLQNCTVYFEGSALRTLKLASLFTGFAEIPDYYKATVDKDGGITI